jgi:hypothetical protein
MAYLFMIIDTSNKFRMSFLGIEHRDVVFFTQGIKISLCCGQLEAARMRTQRLQKEGRRERERPAFQGRGIPYGESTPSHPLPFEQSDC